MRLTRRLRAMTRAGLIAALIVMDVRHEHFNLIHIRHLISLHEMGL